MIQFYRKALMTLVVVVSLLTSWFDSHAVTGRHPTGVNVNANGVTSVLITFQNLQPGELPTGAFWCGDVTATGVVVGTNPCVPGTLLGNLPAQYDISQLGRQINPVDPMVPGTDLPGANPGTNPGTNPRNLTDVMSIPVAVIRRAYQEAQRGNSSEFYYVRQFTLNGVNTYVTVTCRMAGGGARTPLSLTRVDLDFVDNDSREPILFINQGDTLPAFTTQLAFNGAGVLKGRWEIVTPGQTEPTPFDLLTEASLQPEDRGLQKRYLLVSRFQKMLAPTGKITIAGPDPRLLPTQQPGLYRVLFRVEATTDVESLSDTSNGILQGGAVAGFPMPTLRYFVGTRDQFVRQVNYPPVELTLPRHKRHLNIDRVIFQWRDLFAAPQVAVYQSEFYDKVSKKLVGQALIKPGIEQYRVAKNLQNKLTNTVLWRIRALDADGNQLSESNLREITLAKTQ